MPLSSNLAISPYFDDFDPSKNYYRVLSKPQVAVQARELNTVQSILQDQIEKFANWSFQNGDIVSGCSISDIPVLPYAYLSDFQANGATYSASDLVGTQAVSQSSNLTARVILASDGFEVNYPNTSAVYLSYVNTGNGGQQSFSNTDQLVFYIIPRTGNNAADTVATVNVYSNSAANTLATGNSHALTVSDGIVFLNGTFVEISSPVTGLVNAYGTYAGNTVVGFQASEDFITAFQDSSLFDNAAGYRNANAPGADRLSIKAKLVALDPTTAANTEGFSPIATYNYGSILSSSATSSNIYSIVGNAIASRIYDEAGNYVVNPFAVDSVTTVPGGSNSLPTIDANTVYARVQPGYGYALGQEVEVVKTAYVTLRRGVDTKTNREQQVSFNYGNYLVLNECCGSFPIDTAGTVYLYNQPQRAVTSRTYGSTSPAGALIGQASARCFTYVSGIPGTNTASYYLHLFDVRMNPGMSTTIGSVYSNSGSVGIGDVVSSGLVGSASDDQVFSFGTNGIMNLRDSSNNLNTEYTYRTVVGSTLYSNGLITYTLTSSANGGIDILPYGVGQLTTGEASDFVVTAAANGTSNALSGNVSVYSTNTAVLGNGTTFTSDFTVGDLIEVNSAIRAVSSVTNATFLSVDSAFGTNLTGQTYYKSFQNGKAIPLFLSQNSGGSYVEVANSTSFSMTTTQYPSSSLAVKITMNVLRTSAQPAMKVVKKNRYVKIYTANNPAGPNGPWCLGIPDVHNVTAIYGGSSSYSTSGVNLSSAFSWSTGQSDTDYGLGYIYPNGSYSNAYPYVLVQLDCFGVNNASGSGFFTVESYPIDDVNVANSAAIQTKDLPLYVDSTGANCILRNCVDFRVIAQATANDTGSCDTSNSSQVTTAISYATVNPSSNGTYQIPGSSLHVPAYGENLQSDYTFYLPRVDLLLMTPNNVLKVKEGLSSQAPQTPLFPDNAMPLASINVPPYPSLSGDQLNADAAVNQRSYSLVRDTSSYITMNLVTNRRYTMQDIGTLDQRISDLEYYMQLTLGQQSAAAMVVTDANGLERFKNGIFVDSFTSFLLSDVSDPEYSIAIDTANGIARPKFTTETCRLSFNSNASVNVQKTGRAITLPYVSAPFITQPYATKYRSAALVASHWNGTVILMPPYDSNVDESNTAAASITINNAIGWQEFANTPFASVWGSWQTSTNTTSSTVSTGTASRAQTITVTVPTEHFTGTWSGGSAEQNLQDAVSAALARYPGATIGSVSLYDPDAPDGGLTLTENSSGQMYYSFSEGTYPLNSHG